MSDQTDKAKIVEIIERRKAEAENAQYRCRKRHLKGLVVAYGYILGELNELKREIENL